MIMPNIMIMVIIIIIIIIIIIAIIITLPKPVQSLVGKRRGGGVTSS